VGVTNLRVGGREGLNCLDYHRQEMRGKMGEVSLQKSLQHRAGSRLAARGRSQGCGVSGRAGHQATVVEVAKTGVAGNNSAHS
jgi:hypothetical protein